ncbi:proline iminopeptidase [Corynebacterium kutscheri]|uniref:alpha/beta fold hydrolase n=1 Tax=Corynebacterium kutscheri TaxID=35755 RepID=UPI000F6E28EA|nr:alpha/beta fold hydrolase [Corynebacterium kutscheri]VEH79308.1 proline iminopeptidase [Corynebacterium kutscheri]
MYASITDLHTSQSIHLGHTIKEHRASLPWDHKNPGRMFELFVREIIPPGGEDYPVMVYLQGGPGFPAPRPTNISGVIGQALKEFRVLLLDQRGTGRSTRIDSSSDESLLEADILALLRQEHIVYDCEALREALGVQKWSLFGQSFGGFCITSYLSSYPESIEHAYLTGGLPATDCDIDEVYRATFSALADRQEQFFAEYGFAVSRIREIADHLDNSDERLATGERLSSRRFRTLGIELGRGDGFHNLAYLLEDPFHLVKGEKRLKRDFLNQCGNSLSFEYGPLYAAIHESIYGGVSTTQPTAWSAHRIREEIEGFEENADPHSAQKFYLTGEHIFPWLFDEDPTLAPFVQSAHDLAAHTWQQSPYDTAVLTQSAPVSAAVVYLDDIFVPFTHSMSTARAYQDMRLHVTNEYQHNGIYHNGAGLFTELRKKVCDH